MRHVIIASVIALAAVGNAKAGDVSPIFGKADVTVTTQKENKAIVGKGAVADVYGYYGNLYSYNANVYGNLGFSTKIPAYYADAYGFAYNSYVYYFNAYNYQRLGL